MDQKLLYTLKSKATEIPPTIQIGKNKITDQVISEIINQFKHTDLIKVKFLSSYDGDKPEASEQLAQSTKSELIDTRGNTAILYRRKR